MKSLDRICLILLTLGVIYMAWALHCSTARMIESTEISMGFATDKIKTVMDERNLAESHVAYLKTEIDRWHKKNHKEGKSGDPKENKPKKGVKK